VLQHATNTYCACVYTKIVQYTRKYEILRYVNIFCYLLIVVVVKYSLVKIQDDGNRKWKWSKSSS